MNLNENGILKSLLLAIKWKACCVKVQLQALYYLKQIFNNNSFYHYALYQIFRLNEYQTYSRIPQMLRLFSKYR